ncbi:DUF4340 domain-containing protein [Treponema sp.]|uniref:DUF4340 domain-containing protein n=1 Tax=Treponema sp. TaxID=166 RepID=UPI0025FE2ECE|nr:DUF4340 domain-containing protein [Treponema sp.]MCR5218972.1 DUF4340 domain-containing protein [Treponema sp.]
MNKLCIKKIVLLGLIAVFLCVYIVQLATEGKNETRILSLSSFDSIEINWKDGADDVALKLIKKDGKYFTEKNNYEVDASSVNDMEEVLKSINVLSTVASSVKDNEERYGLGSDNAITVKVYDGNKIVRSILVGKDSSTNTRSFVRLDDEKEVVTVQGALHSIFAVTEDTVRSKSVYSVDSNLITKVHVKTADEEYEIAKVLNSTDASNLWEVTLNNTKLEKPLPDASKIKAWLNLVSSLEVNDWQAADTALYHEKADVEFEFTAGVNTTTVKIYKGAEENSDAQVVCSSTPYRFTVPSYYYTRFGKHLDDIVEHNSAE